MRNLIVVLMGGLSGERKISFLSGKACSKALRKKKTVTKGLFPHPSGPLLASSAPAPAPPRSYDRR